MHITNIYTVNYTAYPCHPSKAWVERSNRSGITTKGSSPKDYLPFVFYQDFRQGAQL